MADDGLSPTEQAALSDLIAAERAKTAAQIDGLTREFDGIVEWSETPPDDEHDPEGATLAFERAQVSAMLSHARSQLADLDQALELLCEGSYGQCRGCGRRIVFERLMARPTAQTCVDCAGGRSPRRRA
jgi:RNA polymerase-binding transcription factor DksA